MKNKIPTHVGIIMDGNGRWATRQGLKRTDGHYAGYKRLKQTALHILSKGVKVLSVFAFSTENFGRSEEEVSYLMSLFVKAFKSDKKFFIKNNIKVVFSGRHEPLSDEVWNVMREIEESTKDCTGGVFNFCINYGGQSEIVDASKTIAKLYKEDKISLDEIDTNTFYKFSYSELYFTSTCFPDFDEIEFDKALDDYQSRNITKGKIK